MTNNPPLPNAVRDRSVPSWCVSLVLHAVLLAVVLLIARNPPIGVAEEPGRTAGIVLKSTSAEGELYEGEEDLAESAHLVESELTAESLLDALPQESAAPEIADVLPNLPAIGAGSLGEGGLPAAGELTLGGGGGRPQLGGGKARVRVFGVEGVGSRFVYVFDRSVSMAGAPLAAARQQLIQSLEHLEEIHQFHIIFFNHRMRMFNPEEGQNRIAFATPTNKQLAARFVEGIVADGGTDRFAALMHAVRLRPDAIFFLTDADDPMPAGEVAKIHARNRRAGTAIHTIEFGHGSSPGRRNFLVRLAEQSGGQYVYVDTRRLRGN